MASKTIKINPDLFRIGKSTKQRTKTLKNRLDTGDKRTLTSLIKPNKMKRELLKLVRNKQKRDNIERNKGVTSINNNINKDGNNKDKDNVDNIDKTDNNHSFANEFKQSIEYIQKLIDKKKQQKTVKNKEYKDYKNNSGNNTGNNEKPLTDNIINKSNNYLSAHNLQDRHKHKHNGGNIENKGVTIDIDNIVSDGDVDSLNKQSNNNKLSPIININTIDDIDIFDKNYIKPNLVSNIEHDKDRDKVSDKDRDILKSEAPIINPNINNIHDNKFKIHASKLTHKEDPPYGCLKGGNKPTFKQYNKTIKKNLIHNKVEDAINNIKEHNTINREKSIEKRHEPKYNNIHPLNTNDNEDVDLSTNITSRNDNAQPIVVVGNIGNNGDIERKEPTKKEDIIERKNRLQKIKLERNIQPTRHNVPIEKRYKTYKKRTIKTNYKLGKYKDKNKNKNSVGVLIKNNVTRKKIKDATDVLLKTPIVKIKKYLREKNMIKFGSYAPNNILRQIFVDSILSGDITNKSGDILIHNYFNEGY
jgi:hypothetical protein